MMTLKDEIETAEQRAAESHKAAMNSYGAGYDAGYVAGLKAAAELRHEDALGRGSSTVRS